MAERWDPDDSIDPVPRYQPRQNSMWREFIRPKKRQLLSRNGESEIAIWCPVRYYTWTGKLIWIDVETTNQFSPSSIFPFALDDGGNQQQSKIDMRWYDRWIRRQADEQPELVCHALEEPDPDSNQPLFTRFQELWTATCEYVSNEDTLSIDSIVQYLKEQGFIRSEKSGQNHAAARALVFAIIGWQTMLYKPDLGSCPMNQLCIADELDGFQCNARMILKQSDIMCKRPLHQSLMAFGIFLPPSNFNSAQTPEDRKAFSDFKVVDPSSCNAVVIANIGRLTIKWIDSLSCHLELDQSSKILYLYRYPSFCVANINTGISEKARKGTLKACGSKNQNSGSWATETEINQLLTETLTTYRLLFGQTKSGRQLFRQLNPFDHVPDNEHDPLLKEICSCKHGQFQQVCAERETYDLGRDFPIYRARLAVLQRYLSLRKPRTWREMWKDKRDSAQWFTFWAVLIIGGLGILLAIAQVILQIVQVVLTTPIQSP